MISPIGFITSQPRLERTGRVGGNIRCTVDQHTLKETEVMIPKSVTSNGQLSTILKLD